MRDKIFGGWWLYVPFALFMVYCVVYFINPSLDLAISSNFYDATSGARIYSFESTPGMLFELSEHLIIGILALFFVAYMFFLVKKRFALFHITFYKFFYFYLVFFISEVLALIVKHVFSRPRPFEVSDFGGDARFYRLFEINHEGKFNSFPSGHATIGFMVLPIIFMLMGSGLQEKFGARLTASVALLCVSFAVAYERIAVMKHFSSDVLASFFLVYFVSYLVYISMRSKWIKDTD